jgi:hypothetical protein
MIRFKNKSIITNNFVMECKGRNQSNVLEDEMYMSNILMLADTINCKWFEIPLGAWKTTLHLEYGICYPFTSYTNTTIADPSKVSHTACLFMNPTRRSVMLWVLDKNSAEEYDEEKAVELEERNWVPSVSMIQEFTVTSMVGDDTTKCPDMDAIIESVYAMGYGPCPFFRRSGVLINTSESEGSASDPDSYRLGCVVPHSVDTHGCCHSHYRKCYFCPHNPFYEVSFSPDTTPVRVQPLRASHHVVAVGTKLLLSINSPELCAMVITPL